MKSIKFTLPPAIFMLITAIGALGWQFGKFARDGDWFLVGIDIVLAILAFSMILEVRKWIYRTLKKG